MQVSTRQSRYSPSVASNASPVLYLAIAVILGACGLGEIAPDGSELTERDTHASECGPGGCYYLHQSLIEPGGAVAHASRCPTAAGEVLWQQCGAQNWNTADPDKGAVRVVFAEEPYRAALPPAVAESGLGGSFYYVFENNGRPLFSQNLLPNRGLARNTYFTRLCSFGDEDVDWSNCTSYQPAAISDQELPPQLAGRAIASASTFVDLAAAPRLHWSVIFEGGLDAAYRSCALDLAALPSALGGASATAHIGGCDPWSHFNYESAGIVSALGSAQQSAGVGSVAQPSGIRSTGDFVLPRAAGQVSGQLTQSLTADNGLTFSRRCNLLAAGRVDWASCGAFGYRADLAPASLRQRIPKMSAAVESGLSEMTEYVFITQRPVALR